MSIHYPSPINGTFSAYRSTSERVADLVSRYPGVTDDEAKEILTFIRTGRQLEVGLLTTDDTIRPNLDAFMQDHKEHFRVKWWETTALVGGIAAALAAFWLIWEAFA
ncbi:MAG TPA: hypothetical protein VN713_04295 [Sphingomicrobium sp.]|nr:hypothetical protein [Sphingomicrobium sp.]